MLKLPESCKTIFEDLINEEIFKIDNFIQTCINYKEEKSRATEIAEAREYKKFLNNLLEETI